MYIKLFLFYFYYLIIKNPVKIFYLIISLITYNYAGTFENIKREVEVVNYFTSDNTHLYVYKKAEENQIKYEVFSSNEKQNLINGMLIYYEYNGTNILLWLLWGSSIILFIVSILMGRSDESTGWNSDRCFNDSLKWFIKCDSVNGKYYYHAFNKLIRVDSYTHSSFRVDSFSDLRLLPTYHSKEEIRDKLLKKIGI
jgi:hypothetical protein